MAQDETAEPVVVRYFAGGQPQPALRCELLVVACDPRVLFGICDYSIKERAIFSDLRNFTFHTTPVEVDNSNPSQFGIILAPAKVELMNGSVSGFRNESAKQYELDVAQAMGSNLLTVYQLQGITDDPWTPEKFLSIMESQIKTLPWWNYGTSYKIVAKPLTTPYFGHFPDEALIADRPWQWLDLQGERNTVYVHASTCFESVLQCWQYANLLFDDPNGKGLKLPQSKSAKIVIIGAGVSGLLFAERLMRAGYTNTVVLESTARFGGKSHSITRDKPRPPGNDEPSVFELGTCYMSAAYDEMVTYLEPYWKGKNDRRGFETGDPDNPNFRGMVATGEMAKAYGPVIGYDDYIIYRGAQQLGYTLPLSELERLEVEAKALEDLVDYCLLHEGIMGTGLPMPMAQPLEFLQSHDGKTFLDFLTGNDLGSLVGLLEYAYSVQGYGPLDQIPAYYGLVWITPALIEGMFLDTVEGVPLVTFWSKGWLHVWEEMMTVLTAYGTKFTYDVTIDSITRPN